MADDGAFGEEGTLVLEQRFAIVPEWIIDAPISDCAFRLYAVLLRYGPTAAACGRSNAHEPTWPNAAKSWPASTSPHGRASCWTTRSSQPADAADAWPGALPHAWR